MGHMHRLFNTLMGLQLSAYVGQKTMTTDFQEQWIPCRHGYDLYAHIHFPTQPGPWPALVVVPGGLSSGMVYDQGSEITITEIASHGFIVLHYDPSGRGHSGGQEDYWGEKHQDEMIDVLHFLIQHPAVKHTQVGVFSFSIGNAIAIGALGRHQPSFVSYLFDWEGPSNRFNITKNDTHPPLQAFPSTNLHFWHKREPINFIQDLRCGYFRYQALYDHMQGTNKSHAIELVHGATNGQASWTQLNNNPVGMDITENTVPHSTWISPWHNHKGQLLKFLLKIAGK